MRTTISLDPDVEALLRAMMKERGVSFKDAVNGAIRAGLTEARGRRGPFIQKTASLGPEQYFRWDKALQAAANMEDEELSRKFALRK